MNKETVCAEFTLVTSALEALSQGSVVHVRDGASVCTERPARRVVLRAKS